MSDLSPLAFDIETSGLELGSVITVASIAIEMGAWFALNTTDRNTDVNADRLAADVEDESPPTTTIETRERGRTCVEWSQAALTSGRGTRSHPRDPRQKQTAIGSEPNRMVGQLTGGQPVEPVTITRRCYEQRRRNGLDLETEVIQFAFRVVRKTVRFERIYKTTGCD